MTRARLVSIRALLLSEPDRFQLLREVFDELLATRKDAGEPGLPEPRKAERCDAT